MKSLAELRLELEVLNAAMRRLTEKYGCDDLAELDFNRHDPEELFIYDELCTVLKGIDLVSGIMDYLSQPVIRQGPLLLQENGTYLLDGLPLNKGTCIEVYYYNDSQKSFKWQTTSMEHNGKEYYLDGFVDMNINGILARMR